MLYVASSTRQKDEQAMRASRKILNVKTYQQVVPGYTWQMFAYLLRKFKLRG